MATVNRPNDCIALKDDYQYDEIENLFIPLKDGTQLSARIWLPKGKNAENPVPAVLEFLPYRKRDMTTFRDEITYPYLAHHGYAGIRVDQRGCGDSSGVIQDEYNEQELSDCEEVLEWIASQDWCSGAIGMQGISWGGFNSVQLAYRQPPALKAIIVNGFTTDRYADDIHYKGGALLLANIQWANCMNARHCLPADPLISDDWREKWLQRLQDIPRVGETWLTHQLRDDYWKHGSVCEDFSRMKTPVFMIGGYNDGYTNSVPKMLNNIDCPKKALIGPWVHLYPHLANPNPQWAYLEDSVRWWDKWLKGIDNGQDEQDDLIAYVCDMPAPRFGDDIAGRFITQKNGFKSDNFTTKNYGFKNHTLTDASDASDEVLSICSPETTGLGAGQFFPYGPPEDFSTDQKIDDAGSMIFDTNAFEQDTIIFGQPRLTINLSADKPIANAFIRLSVVHENGDVRRISYTPINMNHDDSHQHVSPLKSSEVRAYSSDLDMVGERIAKGAKLRISISSAYFPMCWSNPEHTTISVHTKGTNLTVPVLNNPIDAILDFAKNEGSQPNSKTQISEGNYSRIVNFNTDTGMVTTTLTDISGTSRFDDHGLELELNNTDVISILPKDPNSAKLDSVYTSKWSRGDWSCSSKTHYIMTSDKDNFYLDIKITASEGATEIFSDAYVSTIKRNSV